MTKPAPSAGLLLLTMLLLLPVSLQAGLADILGGASDNPEEKKQEPPSSDQSAALNEKMQGQLDQLEQRLAAARTPEERQSIQSMMVYYQNLQKGFRESEQPVFPGYEDRVFNARRQYFDYQIQQLEKQMAATADPYQREALAGAIESMKNSQSTDRVTYSDLLKSAEDVTGIPNEPAPETPPSLPTPADPLSSESPEDLPEEGPEEKEKGPEGKSEWTDEQGNQHTVERDADGNKIETTEYKDGRVERVETRADGTVIETSSSPEAGTTVKTTRTGEDGRRIETTELPDGARRTVTTDPATGETVTEFEESGSGSGGSITEQRDSQGRLVSRTRTDSFGNPTITETDDQGRTVEARVDPWQHTTVTEFDRDGYGTERVYDPDGNLVSEKRVLVENRADDMGNTVRTTRYDEGPARELVLDQNGDVLERREAEGREIEPGRHLFEEQKRELGLRQNWEDLSDRDREQYRRDQEFIDQNRESRERLEAQREKDQARREASLDKLGEDERVRQEAERGKLEAIRQEQAERQAALDAEKAAAEQAAADAREKGSRARAQEEQERRRQAEFDRRWEEADPQTPQEVRQFEMDMIQEEMHKRRDYYRRVIETGAIASTDENGNATKIPATPEQLQDARRRVQLADNLDQMLKVDGANHLAQLHTAREYSKLMGGSFERGNTGRDEPLAQAAKRSFDMSDLAGARGESDDLLRRAENDALRRAGIATREDVQSGILAGSKEIAYGMTDWFSSMNPADPLMTLAFQQDMSGADMGRELTVGEAVYEAGASAAGELVFGGLAGRVLPGADDFVGTGRTASGGAANPDPAVGQLKRIDAPDGPPAVSAKMRPTIEYPAGTKTTPRLGRKTEITEAPKPPAAAPKAVDLDDADVPEDRTKRVPAPVGKDILQKDLKEVGRLRKEWMSTPQAQREAFDAQVHKALQDAAGQGDKWARRVLDDLKSQDAGRKFDYFYEPALKGYGVADGNFKKNYVQVNPYDPGTAKLRSPESVASSIVHEYAHTYKGEKSWAAQNKPGFKGPETKGRLNEVRAHLAESIFQRNLKEARRQSGQAFDDTRFRELDGMLRSYPTKAAAGSVTRGRELTRNLQDNLAASEPYGERFSANPEVAAERISTYRGGSMQGIQERIRNTPPGPKRDALMKEIRQEGGNITPMEVAIDRAADAVE
ncbi:MAG: hypothetical protein HY714_03650 [Candidatus Omnitrophica bacterium]|nr:hypothetical protein [Candidatus Omnitrophota bacterium]